MALKLSQYLNGDIEKCTHVRTKRMHCTDVASMIPVILTKPGTYSLDGVARSDLEELSLVRIHPLPSLSSSLHSKSLIKKALREISSASSD